MIGGDINELRDELIHAKQEFDAYHDECEHGHASTDLKTYMSLADQIVESRKAFLKVLDELTLDALALQSMTPDGKRLMLTASAQKPGHYQLTRFDDQGAPWGDTNYPTKMAALVEFAQESDLATIHDYATDQIIPVVALSHQDANAPCRPRM